CDSSALTRSCGGSSTASTAGRRSASVARSKSGVRRRSTGTPRRTSTSYSARLPSGPLTSVDARESKVGCGPAARRPAQIARASATRSSSTSVSSTRRDMLVQEVDPGRERAVDLLVAGSGAEHVVVESGHELAQRGAPRLVEPRFAYILRGRLGWMELERLVAIELEQHRHEAVRQGLGVAARAGELLTMLAVGACVLERQARRTGHAPRGLRSRSCDPP